MHAFAVFAVNEHLEFLLDEAAQRRATARTSASLRARVVAAVKAYRTPTAFESISRVSVPLPR
jgi:hypothetical protein